MKVYFKVSSLLILLALSLANIGLWSFVNRPMQEKPWSGIFRGLSYSPFHGDQDPQAGAVASYAEIDEDLRFLQDKTTTIRTYSALDGIEQVPRIAAKYGLRVVAGAWIDNYLDKNEREIQSLIWVANHNSNVDRVLVGNETLLRADVTPEQMLEYIRRVKEKVKVPVSTAEPWHVWLKNPALAKEVDYIAVHILPYWEGQPLDHSMDFILEKYDLLAQAYPNKHIVITEVGWPSDGRMKKGSVPSLKNQALFLRQFLNMANSHRLDYSLMEAFDQPWKRHMEGSVGSYWGIYDNNRNLKIAMAGPVVAVPHWPYLATASTILALIPMAWFLGSAGRMRVGGRIFYATIIQAVATTGVWAFHIATDQYLTQSEIVTWCALGFGLALLMAILLAEAFELAESFWLRLARRPEPVAADPSTRMPRVSVHIPIYNEPPELVIESLEALGRLDYPNYEVVVIDNNTKDPKVWAPVEAWCKERPDIFRFFHLDHCPGFKAGALNFTLKHMDQTAEVVAVIDSDYTVKPDWLKSFAPYFNKREVGFVQAPQDYRDWRGSLFKEMCYWEYAGFFHIGMVVRNERNAIIQHGTMTMVRKTALEEVGGWAEWCITEDAELGVKLMAHGYDSLYLNQSFGQGVTPDTYAGYKSQRFRWAYGAIQIMKRHWREFIPWAGGSLTPAQQYHFVAGWLPWIGDALNTVFTFFALFWTIGLIAWPKAFDFPLTIFISAALGLFVFKTIKSFVLYSLRIRCSLAQNIGAAIAALSLTHTVGKAVWSGIFTSGKPFLRTPKLEDQPAVMKGLLMAWEESLLTLLLWIAAAGIVVANGSDSPESWLWAAMLVVQSIPYAASLITAMVSIAPQLFKRRRPRVPMAEQPRPSSAMPSPSAGALPLNRVTRDRES
jgi:exo-beta-1,3-glucanase (GH17 family)/cellulose synthase/poly-beta-1,6-N-acetylglucosamine synthase-like glycosyltransferase